MPRAVPQPLRQEIVARHQAGEPLTQIAIALQMPYRTLRGIWGRYRRRGEAGLAPDYARCAKVGPRFATAIYEAALSLKRQHPRWGAMRIRIELEACFPQEPLPKRRTLQDWFQQAGLSAGRSRAPAVRKARGQAAHEVWQLDAKDKLRLGDGTRSVSFSMVDEATGAVLGVALFPPAGRHGRAGAEGEGVDPTPAHGVGAAPENAGG